MENSAALLNLKAISNAQVNLEPYPHLVAHGVVGNDLMSALGQDFPQIKKPGFFPLELINPQGVFDKLVKEMEGPTLAAALSDKLNIELRDKPCMITVRKWSASKDGRIHNDGEAKIVTCLLYLNEKWPDNEDGGRFRVLRSETDFEDARTEVPPSYGTLVAFVRTENSWHGHKPFAGERRVIQATWLRSQADLERKHKRGKLSFFLKKFWPGSY